jgi:hypothetical protein
MKRIVVAIVVLGFNGAAFAQALQAPWRSPFTVAPNLSGISPFTAERNRQIREQELAAWAARHQRVSSAPERPVRESTTGRLEPADLPLDLEETHPGQRSEGQ